MKCSGLVVLCGCFILAGCTRAEINEVAPLKYYYGDNAGEIVLKTTGNVVIGAVAVPVVLASFVVMAAGSGGGISGGASSKGVTISH